VTGAYQDLSIPNSVAQLPDAPSTAQVRPYLTKTDDNAIVLWTLNIVAER
jgi:hypothetical protein